MGLALLAQVVRHARDHGRLPAQPQDLRFATKAPMIRRSVVLTDDRPSGATSLVATVMGADRPGIVSLLSDRAQRFGANWAASRLSSLGGEFAGMIHFEVPPENAQAFAAALGDLESSGLRVSVARSEAGEVPAGQRGVELELVGDDRIGIVSRLTRILAERGISIEHIHTELVGARSAAKQTFKVGARLLVPGSLPTDTLRRELGELANEMMVDIALDEQPAGAAVQTR
jgi:glycine cleavage system regulatory protein